MKNIFTITFLLSIFVGFSQDSFIKLKDGNNIVVKNGSITNYFPGRVSYYLNKEGAQSSKSISLKKVEKIYDNGFNYLLFSKKNKKKKNAYKIVLEKKERKLVVRLYYPRLGTGASNPTANRYYIYYSYAILDHMNNILDEGVFRHSGLKNKSKQQKLAISSIKKHFSDCDEAMSLLNSYIKEKPSSNDADGSASAYIAGFFNHSSPIHCE